MRDFAKELDSVKKSKERANGYSEDDIEKIVGIVEKKIGKTIEDVERKVHALSIDVAKNDENIKNTFKVSVGALRKAKAIEANQEKLSRETQEAIKGFQSLNNDVGSGDMKISQELLQELKRLEDKIEADQSTEVVSKETTKVSVPMHIDVKERSTVKEVKKSAKVIKKVEPKVEEKIAYVNVGLFGEVVYLRDLSDPEQPIDDYTVGDDLPSYGKILSISASGKINTESGFVKYK